MPNNTTEKRKFTKFINHHSQELIKAEHINIIQDMINENQKHILDLQNEKFINKVKFEFENNRYVNTSCYDQFVSLSNIDTTKSININYNSLLNTMEINNISKNGYLFTNKISSTVNPQTAIKDIFLLDDITLPAQSTVNYFIVNDNNEEYPIEPNAKDPFNIDNLTGFYIKIELIPNATNESPIINGIATTFNDPNIKYGLDDFDYSPRGDDDDETSQVFGRTILIRSPKLDDKLVKVIEPDRDYLLSYNDKGKLSTVIMIKHDNSYSTKEILGYGDYVNSKGETEEVLLTVDTKNNTKNI